MIDNASWVSLGCVVGIVLVLGGGVLFMLYGWRELVTILRRWVDQQ